MCTVNPADIGGLAGGGGGEGGFGGDSGGGGGFGGGEAPPDNSGGGAPGGENQGAPAEAAAPAPAEPAAPAPEFVPPPAPTVEAPPQERSVADQVHNDPNGHRSLASVAGGWDIAYDANGGSSGPSSPDGNHPSGDSGSEAGTGSGPTLSPPAVGQAQPVAVHFTDNSVTTNDIAPAQDFSRTDGPMPAVTNFDATDYMNRTLATIPDIAALDQGATDIYVSSDGSRTMTFGPPTASVDEAAVATPASVTIDTRGNFVAAPESTTITQSTVPVLPVTSDLSVGEILDNIVKDPSLPQEYKDQILNNLNDYANLSPEDASHVLDNAIGQHSQLANDIVAESKVESGIRQSLQSMDANLDAIGQQYGVDSAEYLQAKSDITGLETKLNELVVHQNDQRDQANILNESIIGMREIKPQDAAITNTIQSALGRVDHSGNMTLAPSQDHVPTVTIVGQRLDSNAGLTSPVQTVAYDTMTGLPMNGEGLNAMVKNPIESGIDSLVNFVKAVGVSGPTTSSVIAPDGATLSQRFSAALDNTLNPLSDNLNGMFQAVGAIETKNPLGPEQLFHLTTQTNSLGDQATPSELAVDAISLILNVAAPGVIEGAGVLVSVLAKNPVAVPYIASLAKGSANQLGTAAGAVVEIFTGKAGGEAAAEALNVVAPRAVAAASETAGVSERAAGSSNPISTDAVAPASRVAAGGAAETAVVESAASRDVASVENIPVGSTASREGARAENVAIESSSASVAGESVASRAAPEVRSVEAGAVPAGTGNPAAANWADALNPKFINELSIPEASLPGWRMPTISDPWLVKKFEMVAENSKGAVNMENLFSGSGSDSLRGMMTNDGLLPSGGMKALGITPFNGEASVWMVGDTFHPNVFTVSTTTAADLPVALNYSMNVANSRGWTPAISMANEANYLKAFELNLHPENIRFYAQEMGYSPTLEVARREAWDTLSVAQRELIENPFPVLYEIKPLNRDVSAFLPNQCGGIDRGFTEIGLVEGAKPNEIVTIYVPAAKVDFVEGILATAGNSTTQVQAIESISHLAEAPGVWAEAVREAVKADFRNGKY